MQTEKSFEHVTNRQGVHLVKKARENGISREEFKNFLDDPVMIKEFFDLLKSENVGWFEKLQLRAGKIGGRVYLIPKIKVDYTRSHNDAAMAVGSKISKDRDVLSVGDKYNLPENRAVEEVIVLVNFGSSSYEKTIEWGIENGLQKTFPHEVFAIGESFPGLQSVLKSNSVHVVETTGCSFEGHSACYVNFAIFDLPESGLGWTGHFGASLSWLAFRKVIS